MPSRLVVRAIVCSAHTSEPNDFPGSAATSPDGRTLIGASRWHLDPGSRFAHQGTRRKNSDPFHLALGLRFGRLVLPLLTDLLPENLLMRSMKCAAALLSLTVLPASAHDLWLGTTHVHGQPEVVALYGHPGKFEAATAAKLMEMSARSADGSVTSLSPVIGVGDHVPSLIAPLPVRSRGALVTASYDNGFWSRTADGGYRNVGKAMMPDGRDSSWSLKFAKAMTGVGAPWNQVVGHPLELVPVSDPFADSKELRVKVLFKGQPVADVEIKQLRDLNAGDKAVSIGRTDADGMLTFPHDRRSDYLAVSHKVPSSQPTLADFDTYSATLAIATDQSLTQ